MVKNVIFGIISVLVILIGYLGLTGSEWKQVEREIHISASPNQVWLTLLNIDDWSNWNSTINASSGKAEVGSQLSITMRGKTRDQDGPQYQPTIESLTPNEALHWRATMGPGFLSPMIRRLFWLPPPTGPR